MLYVLTMSDEIKSTLTDYANGELNRNEAMAKLRLMDYRDLLGLLTEHDIEITEENSKDTDAFAAKLRESS